MRSILLYCLLLATGCNLAPDKPVAKQKNTSYRSLGNYHWDEEEQLQKGQVEIRKTVRINEKMDSAVVKDSAGFDALFRPLKEADVSKPSLADAYKTDTIANQFSTDTTFIVRSLGKQTWPYQLILDVDGNGRIRSAQVTSYTRNLMYEYKQEIFYERHKAIRVSSFQKIIFLKPESMEMDAHFYPSTRKI